MKPLGLSCVQRILLSYSNYARYVCSTEEAFWFVVVVAVKDAVWEEGFCVCVDAVDVIVVDIVVVVVVVVIIIGE